MAGPLRVFGHSSVVGRAIPRGTDAIVNPKRKDVAPPGTGRAQQPQEDDEEIPSAPPPYVAPMPSPAAALGEQLRRELAVLQQRLADSQRDLATTREERDRIRLDLDKVRSAEGPYGVVIHLTRHKATCVTGTRQYQTVPVHEHEGIEIGDAVRFAKTKDGLVLAEIIKQPLEACPIVTVVGLLSRKRFECVFGGVTKTCRLGRVQGASVGDRLIVDPDGQLALENLGPTQIASASPPTVEWDDVGGLEDAKRELREAIEDPIKHRDLYRAFKLKPVRGILMHGPPGGGKTLLVRAAATALARLHGASAQDTGFLMISGPQAVLNKFVGETEAKIKAIFDAAREHHRRHGYPAIIVVDECEALMAKRGSRPFDVIGQTIVPTFLAEMDGVDTQEHAPLVILLTNRPDILDDAIVRAKRIDRHIEIGYPDAAGARKILEIHLKDRPREDGIVDALLAKTTMPASGAALEGRVDLLVARAVRRAKVDGDLRLRLVDVP